MFAGVAMCGGKPCADARGPGPMSAGGADPGPMPRGVAGGPNRPPMPRGVAGGPDRPPMPRGVAGGPDRPPMPAGGAGGAGPGGEMDLQSFVNGLVRNVWAIEELMKDVYNEH